MSGIGWQEVTKEEKQKITACFPSHISCINDLVRYENGFVMPRYFAENLEKKIYNFELRDDDIWIVTYPKCGTTWTQELVWMLINDVDIEKGKKPQIVRSPFIEVNCVQDQQMMKSFGIETTDQELSEVLSDSIQFLKKMKGRRVIKSHLPFEFLPPKLLERCKVVYVARNPKDAAVSFYHHNMNVPCQGFIGSFEEFISFYEEGLLTFGSYWNHVQGGWKHRDNKNLKFLWFENMKKDTKAVVDELSEFLQHNLNDVMKSRLCEHVKFENMKKNPYTNPSAVLDMPPEKHFLRRGEVGDWKNYFDKERNEKWNMWIYDNIEGTGMEELEHFKHIQTE